MLNITRFKGRKRIELDISRKDFLANPKEMLKEFMGKAIAIHYANVEDMKKIDDELLENSTIYTKSRNDGKVINNQFSENILWRIWKSKTSYIVGKPIQYANSEGDATNDDMRYFDKYILDCNKSTNDILVYGDVLEYGIGYRMVFGKIEDVDLEQESPVYDYHIDPKDVFIAYSSNFKKEKLFSCIIEKARDTKTNKTYRRYTIYYTNENNECYSVYLDNKFSPIADSMKIEEQKEVWNYNPVIEYSLPKRVGVVELLLSLQNALNNLGSLQFDDIEQFIQAYIVFINNDIDLESEEGQKDWKNAIEEFNRTRAIMIKSINEQMPADLKILTNSLDHSSMNSLKDSIRNAMYNIGGSAIPSQSATSGGDTSVARTMANGYQNALFDADIDTTFLKKAEREWIKILIAESNTLAGNKLENISASSIEIKYNVNMSDNMLVKAQAVQYLKNSQMPPELILQAIPLLSDVYGSAKMWNENIEKEKQEEGEKSKNSFNDSELKEMNNKDIVDADNKGNKII